MRTLSKKLQNILFGKSKLTGELPVVADMVYPQVNKSNKRIEWEGNRGLIFYLIERIEKLENEMKELKAKKK